LLVVVVEKGSSVYLKLELGLSLAIKYLNAKKSREG
jgi:hypothetical protein